MIESYRWLGDLNGINTLTLFEINHHDYFKQGTDREQENQRLERDLKTSYRKLSFKLHPDQQQLFIDSFKKESADYFNDVQQLYDLLTNKEKYKNPNPDEGHRPGYISVTAGTFTLASYVLSLQNKQPDEHPIVSTIKEFITKRDNWEKKIEELLKQKNPTIPTLPPKRPLSAPEYVQVIDDKDKIIGEKDEEIRKLKEEKDKQRQISDGYRAQLLQAIEDRHTTDDVLTKMEKQLEELLK